MKIRQLADEIRFPRMSTQELRDSFLVKDLFEPGALQMLYVDLDRAVLGSAVPVDEPLALKAPLELRAAYFTERRELGVLNIGGPGHIDVDGCTYTLEPFDALYISRGSREAIFHSDAPEQPAEFYLLSYPAHAAYPTTHIRSAEQASASIGSAESCNQRQITRLIHLEGTQSAQLVMGYTRLATGSVWNTMPPHTHSRRSEIYLYFDLPAAERVVHLMGPPHETRHLLVANKQAIISPGWSIHCGVGTHSYSFCWGMGGENQVYSDMDPIPSQLLK